MAKLDAEEREILEAFEAGQLKPVENKEAELRKHRKYAEATFKKDQRINIRISNRDLQVLKKRVCSGHSLPNLDIQHSKQICGWSPGQP
jgi:predicted DNA binding CopG/RHH family protein